MNVYPFIEAEKAQQRNVKRACELLEVSRSAYYAARDGPALGRERADAELTEQISRAQAVQGPVRRTADPRRAAPQGPAARPQTGRPADAPAGLAGRAPKRWKKTTIPDPAAAVRADLIRRDFSLDAARINQRWCGDITYITTWEGWLYLATVIDIASRRVVGWAMADHLRTDLVADALANAVAARDPAPGVVFHSDRGCQYTSPRSHPGRRLPGPLVGRPHRPVLGQRTRRVVLRLPQGRAASTRRPGPAGPAPAARSWSTSPGTTAPGCTAPWATSAPPSTRLPGRRTYER